MSRKGRRTALSHGKFKTFGSMELECKGKGTMKAIRKNLRGLTIIGGLIASLNFVQSQKLEAALKLTRVGHLLAPWHLLITSVRLPTTGIWNGIWKRICLVVWLTCKRHASREQRYVDNMNRWFFLAAGSFVNEINRNEMKTNRFWLLLLAAVVFVVALLFWPRFDLADYRRVVCRWSGRKIQELQRQRDKQRCRWRQIQLAFFRGEP